MNRREFGADLAGLLLGGATITILGCGGGSAGPTAASPTAGSPPLTDAVGAVSSNHGHSAVITAAQLAGGGDLELDIRGDSSHPHAISLSAGELESIRRGARVEKESSGASHTHTVVFNG